MCLAGHEQQIGMARAGHELDPQSLQFAAVAGARIDVAPAKIGVRLGM